MCYPLLCDNHQFILSLSFLSQNDIMCVHKISVIPIILLNGTSTARQIIKLYKIKDKNIKSNNFPNSWTCIQYNFVSVCFICPKSKFKFQLIIISLLAFMIIFITTVSMYTYCRILIEHLCF